MRDAETIFFEAFEKYHNDIFKLCFYKLSDRELAQDLTQRAFEKTWLYMKDGRKIDNIRAFLYKTARFLIIDEYRKSERQNVSLEKLSESGYEVSEEFEKELIDVKMTFEKIHPHIKNLPAKYEEVITLRYINDLTIQDIAELTGKSENVVSVRLNRALTKLRKLIDSQNE